MCEGLQSRIIKKVFNHNDTTIFSPNPGTPELRNIGTNLDLTTFSKCAMLQNGIAEEK